MWVLCVLWGLGCHAAAPNAPSTETHGAGSTYARPSISNPIGSVVPLSNKLNHRETQPSTRSNTRSNPSQTQSQTSVKRTDLGCIRERVVQASHQVPDLTKALVSKHDKGHRAGGLLGQPNELSPVIGCGTLAGEGGSQRV